MDHVGVRQDHVGAVADDAALGGRGVAVVDRGAERRAGGRHEVDQLGGLVAGERLRREEVERARVGVLEDRVEDGQVVAERLARRGRRDDDDVAAGDGEVVRVALVDVEAFDAAGGEGRGEPRVEPVGEVGIRRLERGLDPVLDHEPGDLTVFSH